MGTRVRCAGADMRFGRSCDSSFQACLLQGDAGEDMFCALADNAPVSWVRTWLRAWLSQPLELVSPLPVQAVRERLVAGRMSYLRAFFMLSGSGGYVVLGRVGTRRISLEAAKVGVRNAWRPAVRGCLEPAGTGCRFVGTIGISPFVKAFSGLWLGGVICAFFGFVAVVAVRAVRGEATGEDLLGCLVPPSMMAGFVALTAWGTLVDRGEATYLRSWLADRLQTVSTRASRPANRSSTRAETRRQPAAFRL